MTVRIVHKNSSESGKNPTGSQLANGELAVNYNADGPFLSIKDTNGRVTRVGGVWMAQNSPPNPAHCSLWVDADNNVLYIWDNDAGIWRNLSTAGGGGGGGGGAVDSVRGGNGIDAVPTTGDVTVTADIDTNRGLEFQATAIAVKLGTGLSFDGTGAIEAQVGQALTYIGTVNLETDTTLPASPNVGDTHANIGSSSATASAQWQAGSTLTGTDNTNPGDLVIWNGTTWTWVPTGSAGDVVDLGYTPAANQGTITNTGGDDAIIPFADHDEAGLFIEPNNTVASTDKQYVRRSVTDGGGDQTHSWQELTINAGTVTSITPGDGLQNADGSQNAITAAGELDIDLAANSGLEFVAADNNSLRVNVHTGLELSANGVGVDLEGPGAGTGGLEFDGNEIRVDAGQGIELTAGGVAADLGAGLNFDGTGQIQIDAANMPAPGNDQSFGYWTRTNATSTLSPRTANDNLNQGSGTITTTGAVTGGSLTASTGNVTLSTAGADLIFTGSDDTPTNRTITVQAPTNAAGFGNYTLTLPTTDGGAGELLQTNGSGVLSWAAQGATVTIGESAPGSPNQGDLWWDSSDASGRLYVWYEDGDTNQWVETSPAGGDSVWERDGTTIKPKNANDEVAVNGTIKVANTHSASDDTGGFFSKAGNVSVYPPIFDSSTVDWGAPTVAFQVVSKDTSADATRLVKAQFRTDGSLRLGPNLLGSTDATGNIVFKADEGTARFASNVTIGTDAAPVTSILDNGKILLGTTDTAGLIDKKPGLKIITGAVGTQDSAAIFLRGTGGDFYAVNFDDNINLLSISSGGNGKYITFRNATDNNEILSIYQNKQVVVNNINSTTVTGSAVLASSSGVLGLASSVRRNKTNIKPLEDVSFLYKLQPVLFNFKRQTERGQFIQADTKGMPEQQYGLIAEDVEQVNPDFCRYLEDENDPEKKELAGVHYDRLVTPLLVALQEQKKHISTLETVIADLSARIAALEGGTN